jgi:hypothetical protein
MIYKAEIINQPYSGEFEERIYDNQSVWNSQNWTWVKFTDLERSEWVGQFRGHPRHVAISVFLKTVVVLTSDYVFRLDIASGDKIEIEDQPSYQNLTVAPSGELIFADYYQIELMDSTLKNMKVIESPIKMDMIEFKNWDGNNLEFTCDEFLNWDRHLNMILDSSQWKIKIKNTTQHKNKAH